MKKTLVPVAVALVLSGCSSSFRVMRYDHSSLIVLKNINDAFPMYASTFTLSLNLATNDSTSVKAKVKGADIEKQVTKLYEDLDRTNADVRSFVIVQYSKYVTAISAANGNQEAIKVAGEAFDSAMLRVQELSRDVRTAAVKISAAKVQNSGWEEAIAVANDLRSKAAELASK
jgi:hypothetical protein